MEVGYSRLDHLLEILLEGLTNLLLVLPHPPRAQVAEPTLWGQTAAI